jgi:hypothetical protein
MASENIILGYRSPKFQSSAEREKQELTLSALRGQQAGAERDEMMRQELSTLGDLSDPERLAGVVQKYDPLKAQSIRASGQESQERAQESKRKKYIEALDFSANSARVLSDKYDELLASGVDDATARQQIQPYYQQSVTQAKNLYPELEMGETYDPTTVKTFALQGSKAMEYIKSKMPEYSAPIETDQGLVQFDNKSGKARPTGYSKPKAKSASIQEYEYAKTQGYKGSFEDFDTKQRKTSAPSTTIANSYNPNPMTLGKAGENQVDEDLLNNTSKVTRLNDIQRTFKPEFLQVGNRAKMAFNSAKLKVGGKIDPKDEKQMTDFANWKRTSITNLNQTIKDLTGAAMGVQEADRIVASLPNPGQGLTDGDDAVTFQSKLNGAIKEVKNAVARGAYIKRNGMSINDVPLDRMPSLMNERAAGIERELVTANPALAKDKKALIRQVRERLSSEFGLVSEYWQIYQDTTTQATC